MKIFYRLALFLLISMPAHSQTAKEVAKKCLPSTVSIIILDKHQQPLSLGSGFIVSKGRIVTNYHVIEGGYGGYILTGINQTKHKIEGYTVIDKSKDLAIIDVPTLLDSPLSIEYQKKMEIGERIYAIGSPRGLSGTISDGIVSGFRDINQQNLIQITAPISPGSSGGPVLNSNGDAIGVAVGTLSSGQNLNFAIPVSDIKQLITKQTSSIALSNLPKSNTQKRTIGQGSEIKEGVSIRNVRYGEYSIGSDMFKGIDDFSVKNNLPYSISDIKILFILYDRYGEPLDYAEQTLRIQIEPNLAKTVNISSLRIGRARMIKHNSLEKIEYRILDFKIKDN